MAYKCVSKKNGGKGPGPDVSCVKFEPKEEKDRKKLKEARNRDGKIIKTVDVYKNKYETGGTKGEEGHETIVTDAMVEEKYPETGGLVSHTKDPKKEYEASKGGKKESVTKETKFYKRKGAIGRALGKDYRQKGGIIETENDGNVTTITYKGKGRKARVKEEKDEKIEESYKRNYDTAMAGIKANEDRLYQTNSTRKDLANKYQALAELPYSRSMVKETKSDDGEVKSYTLGTPYASDREIRTTKEGAKKELDRYKEGTVKMKKRILKKALKKGEYGKS